MIKDPLDQTLQTVHQYLQDFSRLGYTPQSCLEVEPFRQVLEFLSCSLEELSLAFEEVRQQNEALQMAQKTLASERQHYQMLFELAPDGYVVTDLLGMILEANQAMSALLSVRPEELRGKPLTVYIASGSRRLFLTQLQQVMELQETVHWEIDLQPRHQPTFTAGVSVAAIYDSQDQITGLRWLIRDISSLKQAETRLCGQIAAERTINQLKSRFTQTIHHEFRNPLGVISASAQLLERYSSQLSIEKKEQCFQRIYSNVESMTELLEKIFWIDRAYSGQVICQPQAIDIELFCQALVNQYQTKVGEQYRIELICRKDYHPVDLDFGLLQLILSHLLSNALKYSLVGSTIVLEVIRQTTQISFSVRDQGIGIAPEDQPHLFELFYRSQNVETFQGVGLGLAIVKQAVDLHQGAISVTSKPGQGSTFKITLPTRFVEVSRSQF